jgi:hypothetical protein
MRVKFNFGLIDLIQIKIKTPLVDASNAQSTMASIKNDMIVAAKKILAAKSFPLVIEVNASVEVIVNAPITSQSLVGHFEGTTTLEQVPFYDNANKIVGKLTIPTASSGYYYLTPLSMLFDAVVKLEISDELRSSKVTTAISRELESLNVQINELCALPKIVSLIPEEIGIVYYGTLYLTEATISEDRLSVFDEVPYADLPASVKDIIPSFYTNVQYSISKLPGYAEGLTDSLESVMRDRGALKYLNDRLPWKRLTSSDKVTVDVSDRFLRIVNYERNKLLFLINEAVASISITNRLVVNDFITVLNKVVKALNFLSDTTLPFDIHNSIRDLDDFYFMEFNNEGSNWTESAIYGLCLYKGKTVFQLQTNDISLSKKFRYLKAQGEHFIPTGFRNDGYTLTHKPNSIEILENGILVGTLLVEGPFADQICSNDLDLILAELVNMSEDIMVLINMIECSMYDKEFKLYSSLKKLFITLNRTTLAKKSKHYLSSSNSVTLINTEGISWE